MLEIVIGPEQNSVGIFSEYSDFRPTKNPKIPRLPMGKKEYLYTKIEIFSLILAF